MFIKKTRIFFVGYGILNLEHAWGS